MNKIKITKKWVIITSILLFVLAVLGVVGWWANTPKKGKVITAPVMRDQDQGYSVKELNGQYISFSYSGIYIPSSEPARDNFVELHMLRASTIYDKQIAVAVANLPDGNVNSNGAYLLRKSHPDLYKNRILNLGDKQIEVWSKSDGSEETAIMPKGDKVAILSFTSANKNDNLRTEADEVLKSFQWKF